MFSKDLEHEFMESEKLLNDEIGAILKSSISAPDKSLMDESRTFSLLQSFHRQIEEAISSGDSLAEQVPVEGDPQQPAKPECDALSEQCKEARVTGNVFKTPRHSQSLLFSESDGQISWTGKEEAQKLAVEADGQRQEGANLKPSESKESKFKAFQTPLASQINVDDEVEWRKDYPAKISSLEAQIQDLQLQLSAERQRNMQSASSAGSLSVGKVSVQLSEAYNELTSLSREIDQLLVSNGFGSKVSGARDSKHRTRAPVCATTASPPVNFAKLLKDIEQDVYNRVMKQLPTILERTINRRLSTLEAKLVSNPLDKKSTLAQISTLSHTLDRASTERMVLNGKAVSEIQAKIHQQMKEVSGPLRHKLEQRGDTH